MIFFSPFRILAWALGAVVVGIPTAAVVLFLLAVLGSPGRCDSKGREITVDLELAASFQQKWDELNATLEAGQLSSAVFTESEATSRARLWVEQHDAPVTDLYVCFNAEGGSASAKVDLPFLPGDVDVIVEGDLDLTGEQPEADLGEIKMGRLPAPLTDVTENFIRRLMDDQTEEVDLRHDYGLTFGDGELTITGQP